MATKRKFDEDDASGGSGGNKENQPPKKNQQLTASFSDLLPNERQHMEQQKRLKMKQQRKQALVRRRTCPSDYIEDVPKELFNPTSKHRYSVGEMLGSVCETYHNFILLIF